MFANPIIRRYRFSQLRPQQFWVFGALYFCIVLLVLLINSSIYQYGNGAYTEITDLYKGLFVQFTILELFLLWLVCPTNCSNVVTKEIADKSFDFFRMLPVSASQKAIGILVGRNLFCLFTAAINLCLCLFFAFAGDLSGSLIGQIVTILAVLTVTLNFKALLFSVLTYKKNKSTSIPVLLVIGLFAFGPVMGMLANAVKEQKLENALASFFTMEMPILYLISLCAGFTAIWAYIGILRRFTREYESLFSRAGAIIFTISFMAVLFGLFYKSIVIDNSTEATRSFWIVSLLTVVIVPLFSIRSFDKYLEISRSAYRTKGLFVKLMCNSNYVCGLILYAIWLGFALTGGLMAHSSVYEFLGIVMMTFSAYLVILTLIETFVTWQPRNEKIGYLLGFLAILYFALPFIIGGIFDNEILLLFSPLGFVQLFDNVYPMIIILLPVFFNLLYLLPLGLLIGKRYNDLVVIRTQMEYPVNG